MGDDDRKKDVWDILTKVTTGWIAPPTEPAISIESQTNTQRAAFKTTFTNGAIMIKKGYTFRREKLSPTWENRVWEFPCVIIAESEILLQGIFDQMREVFDRYTSAPWSTGTLGTGTTYHYAGIEMGKEDERLPKYVMDVTVYLAEYIVAVVIA